MLNIEPPLCKSKQKSHETLWLLRNFLGSLGRPFAVLRLYFSLLCDRFPAFGCGAEKVRDAKKIETKSCAPKRCFWDEEKFMEK